mmetsp:Transcript_27312/g.24193  ORF Transcript_27312/g.24193 Transcript_27312/m.24193 type:complete len:176 (+) Transcript_27312:311-838(+)
MTHKQMEEQLIKFMKNIKYHERKSKKFNKKKDVLNPDYAHGFVFIFDLSEPQTETITKTYFEAFQSSEANENQSVLATKNNQDKALVDFWGNKADMESIEFAKVKDPEFKRVSAMTNKEIHELFKDFVKRIYLNNFEERSYEEFKDPAIPIFNRLKPEVDPWAKKSFFEKYLPFC